MSRGSVEFSLQLNLCHRLENVSKIKSCSMFLPNCIMTVLYPLSHRIFNSLKCNMGAAILSTDMVWTELVLNILSTCNRPSLLTPQQHIMGCHRCTPCILSDNMQTVQLEILQDLTDAFSLTGALCSKVDTHKIWRASMSTHTCTHTRTCTRTCSRAPRCFI